MNPSYISTNLNELLEDTSPTIQKMILDDEVSNATTILGKLHKLPVHSYVPLSDIISYILIGALKPEDVLRAIQDMLGLSPDDALLLAQDLEKTILEKARIKILGKSPEGMVTITMSDTRSPEELRKEILDTTKRDSAIEKSPIPTPPPAASTDPTPPIKKEVVLTPGSRSQLLEQLQILESVPGEEEIQARLNKIKEQTSGEPKSADEERELDDTALPLQTFLPGDNGSNPVKAEARPANYGGVPTKYNVDPYREMSDLL